MKDKQINYREETQRKRINEIDKTQYEHNVEDMVHRQNLRNNLFFESTNQNTYIDNRRIVPNYCHAFINNISFPTSLEEIKSVYIEEYGQYDVEHLLSAHEVSWTSPKWAMVGDICFFMHAKSANSTISSLKTELQNNRFFYSESDYQELMSWLNKGKQLHKQFGGKIFAVAKVISPIEEDTDDDRSIHWKTRMYANLGSIWLLNEPIDISLFRQYVTISNRGAITPVYGKEYQGLQRLISEKNPNPPDYFMSSVAADAETSRIDRYNWLRVAPAYRHSFIYEKQFRIYYVNYFLSSLGDIKTIYSECRCIKTGVTMLSRVDNIIRFFERYLPVEVKLSVPLENDIISQLSKYCNDDEIFLDKKETRGINNNVLYYNHVLVIDRDNLFLYDDRKQTLDDIYDLDNINTMDDIAAFREMLYGILESEYAPIQKYCGIRNKKRK